MRSVFQVFAADVVSKLFMGAASILFIRFLAPDEYAGYTLALAVAAVATQLVGANFNRIYVVAARHGFAERLPTFLGVQLWALAILIVLGLPLLGMLGAVYWFTALLIFGIFLSDFSKAVFQERLEMLRLSTIELTRTLLFVAASVTLVWLLGERIRAWQVLTIQAAAMLAAFAILSPRLVSPRDLLRVRRAASLMAGILRGRYRELFVYFVVLAFFTQVDVFALKVLSSEHALATYGSASRYYSLLLLALGSVHTVLLPTLQRANQREDVIAVERVHRRMIAYFVPLVIFGAWAAGWLIPWIDAGKYPEATRVFRILSVAAIVSFVFSPHVNLLMRLEDFRFMLQVIAVGLVGVLVLHALLIPRYGASGAAIATLVAFAFVNGSFFARVRSHRDDLEALLTRGRHTNGTLIESLR